MNHKIIPIDELPKRTYTKGSIYDELIDEFIKMDIAQAKIEMNNKKTGQPLGMTYLTGRLRKRIKQREITTIEARTVNELTYLVKVTGD